MNNSSFPDTRDDADSKRESVVDIRDEADREYEDDFESEAPTLEKVTDNVFLRKDDVTIPELTTVEQIMQRWYRTDSTQRPDTESMMMEKDNIISDDDKVVECYLVVT